MLRCTQEKEKTPKREPRRESQESDPCRVRIARKDLQGKTPWGNAMQERCTKRGRKEGRLPTSGKVGRCNDHSDDDVIMMCETVV